MSAACPYLLKTTTRIGFTRGLGHFNRNNPAPDGQRAMAAILKFAIPTGMPIIVMHCNTGKNVHQAQPPAKENQPQNVQHGPPVFIRAFLLSGFSSSTWTASLP
jgi:hypothetical protein